MKLCFGAYSCPTTQTIYILSLGWTNRMAESMAILGGFSHFGSNPGGVKLVTYRNWYLSLSSLVLGITRLGQWLVWFSVRIMWLSAIIDDDASGPVSYWDSTIRSSSWECTLIRWYPSWYSRRCWYDTTLKQTNNRKLGWPTQPVEIGLHVFPLPRPSNYS